VIDLSEANLPSYDFDSDTEPAPSPSDNQMVEINDDILPADPMDVQLEGHKKGEPFFYNYELVQQKEDQKL